MSAQRCDSGHSLGQSTSCMHCHNLGLVNGDILLAYDPINKTPEVKFYKCKYCGHKQTLINPYNLVFTQAEWDAYAAMTP